MTEILTPIAAAKLRQARQTEPDAYEPPGEPVPPRRQMLIEWFDDAAETALSDPNTPLIDGLLDEGAMSVFYGHSNAGKSFAIMGTSHCVSTGTPWNGRAVKHGLVVYVAAEGGMKIKRRIAALRASHLEATEKPLFALVRYPIDLRSSEADLNQLLALIREAERSAGAKCVWIIVDTLSRAMAGGDENSSVDMGRIVTAADRLRAETQAHFTYVHHTGKDAAKGARGHSLLRAATDTEIEITPDALTVTKQRDMEGGFSIGFRLVDVEIGIDQENRPIRSAVVQWTPTRSTTEPKEEKSVPSSMRTLLEVIKGLVGEEGQQIRPFQDGPLVKASPDSAIRKAYYARIAELAREGEDPKAVAERQRKSFNLAIKGAVDRKLIFAAEWNRERWIWLP